MGYGGVVRVMVGDEEREVGEGVWRVMGWKEMGLGVGRGFWEGERMRRGGKRGISVRMVVFLMVWLWFYEWRVIVGNLGGG